MIRDVNLLNLSRLKKVMITKKETLIEENEFGEDKRTENLF